MMTEQPLQTRPSLLIRLRDHEDRDAWRFFAEAYAPLVKNFLCRHGMQESDAMDVVQDVLVAVAGDIRKFQHHQSRPGSFRSWLYTVVRHRMVDYWRRERRHPRGTGESQTENPIAMVEADGDEIQQKWDHEFYHSLFHAAANQVKSDFQETTWQAFWKTTVKEQPAQIVARDLDLSVAAIYMAKRRVLLRIREQIDFLQGDAE